MILHYKDTEINIDLINLKKRINYSKDLTFIPIKYDSNNFIIQTPVMYVPFGISIYSGNKYLDVSFQWNKVTDLFIHECLDVFYQKIVQLYGEYNVDNYIRESQYSKWMRLKVNDSTSFYNQEKEIIHDFPSKVRGSFIIQLSGIWINKEKISIQWILLQGKIYEPVILKEYSFIDEEEIKPKEKKKIPPPPPPPPPPLFFTIKKKPCQLNLNSHLLKNIQLKTTQNKSIHNSRKEDEPGVPTLNEIKNALKNLNRTK